jgi:hypothetical protein
MNPDELPSLVREQAPYVFDRVFSAMDKVRERLERSTKALADAGIPYAIVGGNAVAAWVATKDDGAVRTTKDVDLLLAKEDESRATVALEAAGFVHAFTMNVTMFLDGPGGKPSQAIHVLWANAKVRDDYAIASPSTDQVIDIEGKRVVELLELLQMKLVSNRDKDRVHVRDMIGVGLIDESWLSKIPDAMQDRLQELLDDPDG